MINTSQDLKDLLFRINRKSYPAYKDTKGSYRFPGYVLSIDHVQGDPFAAPSKISLHIKGAQAGFPESLYATREMRIALQNQLIRGFAAHIEKYNFRAKGSGKSGLIAISKPGQEILERSACTMDAKNGDLTIRLEVGFPANGRTINSGELIKILFDFLPVCVKDALFTGIWMLGNWNRYGRLPRIRPLSEKNSQHEISPPLSQTAPFFRGNPACLPVR